MSARTLYNRPTDKEQISAADLRRHVDELRLEKLDRDAHRRKMLEEKRRHERLEFMERRFTETDRQEIKRRMRNAIHGGKFEIEVLQFPASYLDDGGRAINNDDPQWPESLSGYAASCYEAYADIAEPLGYKLIARVLNYPDGMIGTIGLYLQW